MQVKIHNCIHNKCEHSNGFIYTQIWHSQSNTKAPKPEMFTNNSGWSGVVDLKKNESGSIVLKSSIQTTDLHNLNTLTYWISTLMNFT